MRSDVFYKAYTTWHLYPTVTEKDFNKIQTKERSSQQKKRKQHSEKKRVFHWFREIRLLVINWRQQQMTTLTRTEALTGIWRVVQDFIRDLTEQRSAVADEGERRSEAREGSMGGDFSWAWGPNDGDLVWFLILTLWAS